MKSRILSMLLCIVMLFSLLPASVKAAGSSTNLNPEQSVNGYLTWDAVPGAHHYSLDCWEYGTGGLVGEYTVTDNFINLKEKFDSAGKETGRYNIDIAAYDSSNNCIAVHKGDFWFSYIRKEGSLDEPIGLRWLGPQVAAWDPVDGATGYEVALRSAATHQRLSVTTTETQYAFSPVQLGTGPVYFVVRALGENKRTSTWAEGPFNEEVRGINCSITGLSELNAVMLESGTLTWDSVPGAAQYNVWVSLSNTYGSVLDEYVSTNSFDIYRCMEDTKQMSSGYSITITALDSTGRALQSTEGGFYYKSAYQQIPAPTRIHWEGSNIVWRSCNNATSYRVTLCNAQNGGGVVTKIVENVPDQEEQSYAFYDYMIPENSYYCTIVAEGDNGPTSNEAYSPVDATFYDFYIGDTQVTSNNAGNIFGNGGVEFYNATKTLTFRNFNFADVSDGRGLAVQPNGKKAAVYFEQDATIALYGDNTITGSNQYDGIATDDWNCVTVKGDGTMLVDVGRENTAVYLPEGQFRMEESPVLTLKGHYALDQNGTDEGTWLDEFSTLNLYAYKDGKGYTGMGLRTDRITLDGYSTFVSEAEGAGRAIATDGDPLTNSEYDIKILKMSELSKAPYQPTSGVNTAAGVSQIDLRYISLTPKTTEILPTSITLNKSSITLSEGETYDLIATILPASTTYKEVRWETSNNLVVGVDPSGTIYADKPGVATITARTSTGLSTVCRVTVREVVEGVTKSGGVNPYFNQFEIDGKLITDVTERMSGKNWSLNGNVLTLDNFHSLACIDARANDQNDTLYINLSSDCSINSGNKTAIMTTSNLVLNLNNHTLDLAAGGGGIYGYKDVEINAGTLNIRNNGLVHSQEGPALSAINNLYVAKGARINIDWTVKYVGIVYGIRANYIYGAKSDLNHPGTIAVATACTNENDNRYTYATIFTGTEAYKMDDMRTKYDIQTPDQWHFYLNYQPADVTQSGSASKVLEFLTIGGDTIANCTTTMSGTGWSWNDSTATLTLNNYKGDAIKIGAVENRVVTVNSIGINTIDANTGLYAKHGLILTAANGGELNISAGHMGIYAGNSFEIRSGEYNITCNQEWTYGNNKALMLELRNTNDFSISDGAVLNIDWNDATHGNVTGIDGVKAVYSSTGTYGKVYVSVSSSIDDANAIKAISETEADSINQKASRFPSVYAPINCTDKKHAYLNVSGIGTQDDPVICNSYKDLKYAMKRSEFRYIKLNSVAGSLGYIYATHPAGSIWEGVTVKDEKTLILNGSSTFTAMTGSGNAVDRLIHVDPTGSLTIKGSGTIKFRAALSNGSNAVLYNQGNTIIDSSNVNLNGAYNTATYGMAIWNEYGNLTINGGIFTAVNGIKGDTRDIRALYAQGGTVIINDGRFTATKENGSLSKCLGAEIGAASTTIYKGVFKSGLKTKGTISAVVAPGSVYSEDMDGTVTVDVSKPYKITVEGFGNPKAYASGSVVAQQYSGDPVSLKADATYRGHAFKEWVSNDVIINDPTSYNGAYFTMPNKAVTIKATYYATGYNYFIGDTEITDLNQDDVFGDGKVQYFPKGTKDSWYNVLELTDFEYDCSGTDGLYTMSNGEKAAIYLPKDTMIVLNGTNRIFTNEYSHGIATDSGVYISIYGNGELVVNAGMEKTAVDNDEGYFITWERAKVSLYGRRAIDQHFSDMGISINENSVLSCYAYTPWVDDDDDCVTTSWIDVSDNGVFTAECEGDGQAIVTWGETFYNKDKNITILKIGDSRKLTPYKPDRDINVKGGIAESSLRYIHVEPLVFAPTSVTVSGTVNCAAASTLTLTKAGQSTPAYTTSVAAGNTKYSFANVEEGTYKMTVTAPNYLTCEVEFVADINKNITIDMIKKLDHTLSVQNNLAINYYVAQSAIPNLNNVSLKIEKDVYDTGVKTVEKTVLPSKLGDYGYGPEYKFVYEGVASYQAVNEIRASLTSEYKGIKYTYAPDVYSIETYCYNQIGKSSVAAKTKKLLVDLLNYCSASQVHFGIKADTLANRNLTSAQKAMGTTTAPVLNNISGTKSLAGATARFNGKTLVLGNNVDLKIYVLLDSSVQKENVRLRIKYQNVNGENVVAYVPYSEFSYDSGRDEYSAKYSGLIAPEFRKELQLTIMEGEKEISDTDTYSIETYAYNRVNGSSKQTLKDVVTEMMKYSDSALAYFK